MIYKSNLNAPDLRPGFVFRDPPLERLGHDVPSDPDFLPECGYFTHDEAAILYNVANTIGCCETWVDVGARLGWTSAHISQTGSKVWAVDPEFIDLPFLERFVKQCPAALVAAYKADWFYDVARWKQWKFSGFVIDGNHDEPEPTKDAEGALTCAREDCVIVFHDMWGRPVRRAVEMLIEKGFQCRVYWTPAGVAVCWRGFRDWVPPFHVRDPNVDWGSIRLQMKDFRFEDCV